MPQFGELYTAIVYFQGNADNAKSRPVLVVDDTEEKLITIAEVTSKEPKYPPKYFDNFKVEISDWEIAGLKYPSWVKCYKGNVHRISRDRALKYIGTVDSRLPVHHTIQAQFLQLGFNTSKSVGILFNRC